MKLLKVFLALTVISIAGLFCGQTARATNAGNFSVALWVKPTGSVASKVLIGKAEELRVFTDAQGFVGCQIKSTTWKTAAQSATRALVVGTWGHILCTYDLVKLTVYVNGVQVAQTSLATVPDDTTNILKIGQDDSSSTPYGNLAGTIDNFKFFNYVLAVNEVKTEYNQNASLKLGSISTLPSSPSSPSSSSSSSYCVPGDSTSCAGPVAEWNMDEATGQYAQDTSGNGNTGTLGATNAVNTDDPTWVQNGAKGAALKFDGNSDYVDMGDPASGVFDFGPNQDFSFGYWIKTGSSTNQTVVGKKTMGTNAVGWGSYVYTNGLAYLKLSNGSGSKEPNTGVRIDDNLWHYIFFSIDRDANCTPYLDGRAKTPVDCSSYSSTDLSNSIKLTIGASNGGTANYTNGLVDQVRIFNYARSAAQIAWDYNKGAPAAYYRFDECTGTVLHSSSAPGIPADATLNGTLTGGTAGTCQDGTTTTAWGGGQSGKYSASIKFDGTNYVTMPTIIKNVGSVSVWIKPASTTQSIIDLDGGSHKITVSSGAITATGFTTVYVDGKVSSTVPDTSWHLITATATAFDSTAALVIGKSGSSYFNGQLDDVRIYNYPLTALQVRQVYNEGSAVRF